MGDMFDMYVSILNSAPKWHNSSTIRSAEIVGSLEASVCPPTSGWRSRPPSWTSWQSATDVVPGKTNHIYNVHVNQLLVAWFYVHQYCYRSVHNIKCLLTKWKWLNDNEKDRKCGILCMISWRACRSCTWCYLSVDGSWQSAHDAHAGRVADVTFL